MTHPLLESLTRRFGSGYGSDENKVNCLSVMCDLGLVSLTMPARKIVDRDPLVEIRVVSGPDAATQMLLKGWLLLGSSTSEPFEFSLGRPQSVEPETLA
jgi:hypothetical protein